MILSDITHITCNLFKRRSPITNSDLIDKSHNWNNGSIKSITLVSNTTVYYLKGKYDYNREILKIE